jgi:hypothetical protein
MSRDQFAFARAIAGACKEPAKRDHFIMIAAPIGFLRGVTLFDPWTGIEVTGSPRQRSLPILPEGEKKPTFSGSNRRNPGSVARWARHAV